MLGSLRHCCQLLKKESCVGLDTYHFTTKPYNKDKSKVQYFGGAQRWNRLTTLLNGHPKITATY